MKKCKGCGEILQYEHKDMLGYAPNENFDYCQRCFRLTHYGDTSKVSKEFTSNEDIISSLNKINDALFVLIVDAYDALFLDQDYLLDIFKDKKLLLIINKIDLLPKNITDDKIEELYLDVIRKCGNINCLITYKNDPSFNDLFFEILDESKLHRVVFTGRANVGKSSLINKLIGNQELTTSIYPGTTLKINKIHYDGFEFIDTAGLIDEESFLAHLNNKNIKKVLPLKTIKRQIFQLYEDQSYIVCGLLKLDIIPSKNSSVEFMIENNLDIHRTKLSNSERYFNNNCLNVPLKLLPLKAHEYSYDGVSLFYLKGLGLIKVKGKGVLRINVNDSIRIYDSEVNL